MLHYVILRRKWRRDRTYVLTSRGLNGLGDLSRGWSVAWMGRASDPDTALQASKESYQ